MLEFSTFCALIGGLVLFLSLLSVPIAESSLLSKPLIALLLGFVVGPAWGLGWVDSSRWQTDPNALMEVVAKLSVGISLVGTGIGLRPGFIKKNRKSLFIILGPIMIFMWISSAWVIKATIGSAIGIVLILAACLTPTDPVLSSSIVEGPLAEKTLPSHIRHTLLAESSANDGLAYPLVTLSLLCLSADTTRVLWSKWFLEDVLLNVGGGVVCGWLTGMLLGKAFLVADDLHFMDQNALFGTTLALALMLLGLGELIGINGILAIFVSGLAFDKWAKPDTLRKEAIVQAATNQFFAVPTFTLFGIVAPWQEWMAFGISGMLIVLCILLLRRMPWFILFQAWIPSLKNQHESWLIGWFGPMGAAALYYTEYAAKQTGVREIWNLGSLAVAGSIVAHGLSATPFSKLFASSQKKMQTQKEKNTYGIEHAC